MTIKELVSPRERALVDAVVDATLKANAEARLIAQRDIAIESQIERCPSCGEPGSDPHVLGIGLHAEHGHNLHFTCDCGHKWSIQTRYHPRES